jgi:ubiquinone biosynthesis protein
MRRRTPDPDPDVDGLLLGRAAEIARVLARHGLRELRAGDLRSPRERAQRLRTALEELGPTFAKLGQILSTRPDLLPPEFIDELSTLQDRVPPLSEAEVVAVMEGELGVPWEDVFESIEPTPLAAGTIGQVHRARLENGDRVVVKVQRPQAGPDIYRDLGLLELFARKTAHRPAFREVIDLPAVIHHLSTSLRRELDFRQEASNILRMRQVLEPYDRLDVPSVYEELSSARLLVLEEVQGTPVRDAPQGTARREAARQLLESYYRQILTDGFFHADPHPGNLKWWNDRVYFLDFGMVGEVDARTRELLLLMLMAFWRQDVPFLSDTMLMLSGDEQRADLDLRGLQTELGALVDRFQGKSLREIQLGPILQSMTEIAASYRVQLPSSLALTGKALAQMQLATAELDPSLDPFSVAGQYVFKSVAGEFRQRIEPQQLLYDVQKLRLRATRFAEAVERLTGSRAGPKLQVQFSGLEHLESTIRNAARRFSLAIVAGTCIVATGVTADSDQVGRWVPMTLGSIGGAMIVGLVADLLFARRSS